MRLRTLSFLSLGILAFHAAAADIVMARESDATKKYLARATNRTDEDANSKTTLFIEKIVGTNFLAFRNDANEFVRWYVKATSSQATEIGKDPGVKIIYEGKVTSGPCNQKAKRGISYVPQPNAVSELKSSQPT